MLVQFMVKNYLSFKDETIFDLSAIKSYKEHEYNLMDIGIDEKFLKVATIYGANGSGKSNLLIAFDEFKKIILTSFNNVDDENDYAIVQGYKPFKFQEKEENIEFQVIMIINNIEYKYGFEFNKNEIVSEWFYQKRLSTNRNIKIFERYKNNIEFGASVKKYCDIYKEQLPKETLALSFFNKLTLKTELFKEVFVEIYGNMLAIKNFNPNEEMLFLKNFLKTVVNNKTELLMFLKSIDTGIVDIEYKENDQDIEYFTYHMGEDGKKYQINLLNESQGTIKSIIVYIISKIAIEQGWCVLFDELNANLHPFLLKFIVDLFNSENNKLGQLVYTTHDVTLLDKKFFRRDQIWFVEKNKFGHSKLVPLSDYKVRADASFEKDYLSGVYGGIPFIQDFNMKVGE